MKKVLSVIISLLLLVTLLCACEPEDNGKIKVEIGFWPDSSQTSDVAMYREWKEKFEADNPEYEIVTTNAYTYSPETIAAKGNRRELPTIFQTYFTEPEMLIREEYIRPITKQLQDLGWLDQMDDNMRAVLSKDGEVYGVPRDGYGMGLFLNLEMMYDMGVIDKENGKYQIYDSEGKPLYPTTFDEVTELCRKVQDYDRNKYGILILSANKTGGWQLCNIAWNFGTGSLQTKGADGKWTSNLADEGMVKALTWIQELAEEGLCYPGAAFNYNDWPAKIGNGDVLMAFVGNDMISQPMTAYGFSRDNFAFVPMPTGDGESHYALFGGTPFVFAENATDEQVEGALKFLHYIGRSPVVDDITIAAMTKGFNVADSKGMPILPTIKAWKSEEYLEVADSLEKEYINVDSTYMQDFFDTIYDMRRAEEPNYCQEMYGCLDNAIQNILSNAARANPQAALTTANTTFQTTYLSKINK